MKWIGVAGKIHGVPGGFSSTCRLRYITALGVLSAVSERRGVEKTRRLTSQQACYNQSALPAPQIEGGYRWPTIGSKHQAEPREKHLPLSPDLDFVKLLAPLWHATLAGGWAWWAMGKNSTVWHLIWEKIVGYSWIMRENHGGSAMIIGYYMWYVSSPLVAALRTLVIPHWGSCDLQ